MADIITSASGQELILGIGRSVSSVLCSDTDFYLVTDSEEFQALEDQTEFRGATLTNACPNDVVRTRNLRQLQPSNTIQDDVFTIILYDATDPLVRMRDASSAVIFPELQSLPEFANNAKITVSWIEITYTYKVLTIGKTYMILADNKNELLSRGDEQVTSLQEVQMVASRAMEMRITDGSLRNKIKMAMQNYDDAADNSQQVEVSEIGYEVQSFSTSALNVAIDNSQDGYLAINPNSIQEDFVSDDLISIRMVGLGLLLVSCTFIVTLFGLASKRKRKKDQDALQKLNAKGLLETNEGLTDILDTGKRMVRSKKKRGEGDIDDASTLSKATYT